MEDNKIYFKKSDLNGIISISPDVIAGIAADSCLETQGVAAMASGPIGATRGIVIRINDDKCSAEAFIMVRNGHVITEVAKAVQRNMKTAIEAGCGITVVKSDVFVAGIEMKA
ncbi:MAG: Asp23/Gls24 family envelope stress response protein [Clostridia bacterium]|nr:Asp23/Gls24 family envelope stress response protein [Clostridia bacterium]MBR4305085.1 Asp23/Gls24 family envelope stress response protein [Clostridia bacterium]